MIIYGSSISPFVRKVLVALNEKGIRYEHRPGAAGGGCRFPGGEPHGQDPGDRP